MKNILTLVLIVVVLQSCTTIKYFNPNTTEKEIVELSFLESSSSIFLINKGNKFEHSDSLSYITKTLIDSVIMSNQKKFRISDKLIIKDTILTQKVQSEVLETTNIILKNRSLVDIVIPSTIDSLLELNNKRFGLSIVAGGFSRRKGNYSGQVAKGLAVGILTMGMLVPVPVKDNITLYAIIMDSEKNEISFFSKTFPLEQSPSNPQVILNQINKLLKELTREFES
jgi:hypothetical protein